MRGDVPVARGAERPLVRELTVADHVHGESGLDGRCPSRRPLRSTRAQCPSSRSISVRGVVLVPTGSLTNVSQLLTEYPDVRPERIVLMGGAIGLGNITPAAEFNIWADPEAAAIVFESEIELTMVGLDVTHEAIVGPERVERFRAMGRVGKSAEWLDFYSAYHRETYGWDGPPVHDALAVASVIRPELLETAHRRVVIETESELSRGRTVVDLYPRGRALPNAHVAVGVDAAAFLDLLEERISCLT